METHLYYIYSYSRLSLCVWLEAIFAGWYKKKLNKKKKRNLRIRNIISVQKPTICLNTAGNFTLKIYEQ